MTSFVGSNILVPFSICALKGVPSPLLLVLLTASIEELSFSLHVFLLFLNSQGSGSSDLAVGLCMSLAEL